MKDDIAKDWFGEGPRPDPLRAAREAGRPALPKLFYTQAAVAPGEGGFALVLDGRPARTPAKNPLAVAERAVADALAAEWNAQGDAIDPTRMPLTRLVNSALDGVAQRRDAVAEDVARYAGSDLVVYRAGDPARLVEAQARAWDPVLAWARERLGARFALSEGVMHVAQDEAALAAVRAAVDRLASPVALAGLHAATTLTGSVLIALMLADGALSPDEAWAAAHVDEDFQASVWGRDAEAEARRERRRAEFGAAALALDATRR
jgi:chaperone required for assembly of F1-ATPase